MPETTAAQKTHQRMLDHQELRSLRSRRTSIWNHAQNIQAEPDSWLWDQLRETEKRIQELEANR